MNVGTTIDAAAWLGKYLEGAGGDTDLAQAMLAAFAEALMSAEASMQCGAAYGERTPERENSRNGYRPRTWDTAPGRSISPCRSSGTGATFPIAGSSGGAAPRRARPHHDRRRDATCSGSRRGASKKL